MMIKISKDGLTYYKFIEFTKHRVRHGVFTRIGGISPPPFNGLNFGSTTGDSDENVSKNRKLIFKVMDLPVSSIFDVWQVHGNNSIVTSCPRPLDKEHQQADAIITNQTGITLFMRFADCVPIFLYAPDKKVIALVHAGWQGTVKRIVQTTIDRMRESFSVQTETMIAGIGPSICLKHYEIGLDVANKVNQNLPELSREILYNFNGSIHLDLWKANALLLKQSGINQIEQSNMCTFENTAEWFSHRAEGFHSGRFGALITLG